MGKRGLLQVVGLTDNPRGVKIRYKLVRNGLAPIRATGFGSQTAAQIEPRDSSDVVVVKNVSLAEPPKLQFLAWQDEWKTNSPGAVRHPDGSLVTNATELKWLRAVSSGGMVDVSGWHQLPEPRLLKLWFSHPPLTRTA